MSTTDDATTTTMYPPPAALVETAYVSGMEAYRRLCAEAEADYPGYWARQAREMLAWKTPFTRSLDESDAPFFKWFEDGTLNVSYNCLDRQVEPAASETAFFRSRYSRSVGRHDEPLARTCRANGRKARRKRTGSSLHGNAD
jgi:acetyl-CoA synthetase